MDTPEPQIPSQHIYQVKNSAVSNTGTANYYDIAGDQHVHFTAQSKPWTPPLMLPPRAQPFVGREEDIAWLLQRLMADEAGVDLSLCACRRMCQNARGR